MTDGQRKVAFAVAAVAVAGAAALLMVLERNTQVEPSPELHRPVVTPSAPARPAAHAGRGRGRALGTARTTARRFAIAYLARDSGLEPSAAWDELRATTSAALWETLREPARTPPSTQPERATFAGVSGVSETAFPGEVAVTIEYSRAGERRYLRVVLINQAGAWRVARLSI